MTHKSYSLFVVVLFLILFTTGCGSLGTNAVPIQKAQPEPTNTEVVETAIPTETPTPKPPTATPTPEAVLLSSLDFKVGFDFSLGICQPVTRKVRCSTLLPRCSIMPRSLI